MDPSPVDGSPFDLFHLIASLSLVLSNPSEVSIASLALQVYAAQAWEVSSAGAQDVARWPRRRESSSSVCVSTGAGICCPFGTRMPELSPIQDAQLTT